MALRLLPLILLPALSVWQGQAQPPEPSSILLFSMYKNNQGLWSPGAPQFASGFNPNGYNNQPAFFSSHELFLSADYAADQFPSDIVSLDLAQKRLTRVTDTPNYAEFSPTLLKDGKSFSVVRVEPDKKQRIWKLPLDRSGTGYPVLPQTDNVGYHCWLRDSLLAVFLLDDPNYLALIDIRVQRPVKIASNPGRCLQTTPDGELAYVQKATEQTWFIKYFNPANQSSRIIIKTLEGAEDFVVLPDGSLLAGKESRIYQYTPGKLADWKEIADLRKYGVTRISRLAANGLGRLAVVVQ